MLSKVKIITKKAKSFIALLCQSFVIYAAKFATL